MRVEPSELEAPVFGIGVLEHLECLFSNVKSDVLSKGVRRG